MIFHKLMPIWLLVTSSYSQLLQVHPSNNDLNTNSPAMRTEKELDVDAHDQDCFKRGVCRWDMKLYQKMSGLPLIGNVWKEYLSEEKKKTTYLILCILSGLVAALFVYYRRESIVKSVTNKNDEEFQQT